ncbi:MAG TPA: hypothetical protein PLQ71_12430 [Nitrospira sp.]|nr:hypothetical protein [Nitrospira sp.]
MKLSLAQMKAAIAAAKGLDTYVEPSYGAMLGASVRQAQDWVTEQAKAVVGNDDSFVAGFKAGYEYEALKSQGLIR